MPTPAAGIPVAHAIVLGIVQGLTEFLPVSSSGHLILVPWLFGWNELAADPDLKKTFDVALHVGTFVGAAAYFAPDLRRFAKAGVSSIRRRKIETPDERLAWLLFLSSLPAAAVGSLLENFVENELGREWLIALMLIVFGLVLAAADRVGGKREEEDLGWRDALSLGVAQAVALSPGVSRSGVTMTAGRWLGFNRPASARISFLMSLPITGGAAAYKMLDVFVAGDGLPPGFAAPFAWGIVTSAVTGFLAVWALLRLVRTRTFAPFVVYRFLAGLVVIGVGVAR